MDLSALIIFGGVAVMVVCVWLVGRHYPGSGLDVIGMRDARQITEQREALEAEDLEQMLAARNARRKARGEAEITVDELELRVAQELHEQKRRGDEYRAEQARHREATLADEDLGQLLDATNARRRARGAAPRTREDVRREFGEDSSGPADSS